MAGSTTPGSRLDHIRNFYRIMDDLARRIGGDRPLIDLPPPRVLPSRGVYFFMEEGETRSTSGAGDRVVRIGTHALKAGSQTTLSRRLCQHLGTKRDGGGNHRGSVFRYHVGSAILRTGWQGKGGDTWHLEKADRQILSDEHPLEQAVSVRIRSMKVLWIGIDDEPGPRSLRGLIERNSIGLLSNCLWSSSPIDTPSEAWLGHRCSNQSVCLSGLWNDHHTDKPYDPMFLKVFEKLVAGMPVGQGRA